MKYSLLGMHFEVGIIQVCRELIVFQLASVFGDGILYRDSREIELTLRF